MISLHETKGGCPVESCENGVIFGKFNAIFTLIDYYLSKGSLGIEMLLVLPTHRRIDPRGCTVHSAVQHLCFCNAYWFKR